MKITQIGKIGGGQDGAIYGELLFRLDHTGGVRVYDLSALSPEGRSKAVAVFTLGSSEKLIPHSNAVFFGEERYSPEDEFPILYSNVYNNLASAPDPMPGTLCAYRILRTEDSFSATLVQLIRVGFCEDATLWRASEKAHGVRPYGNFVLDKASGTLYAFVMRDELRGTRYFSFAMPSVHDGEMLPAFGVRGVTLTPEAIRGMFDMPYYRFIQGAIAHGGYIYSTEGFSHSEPNPPAIRVVDPSAGCETYYSLPALDIWEEPEMIDFYRGTCYYSDACGNLYTVSF